MIAQLIPETVHVFRLPPDGGLYLLMFGMAIVTYFCIFLFEVVKNTRKNS